MLIMGIVDDAVEAIWNVIYSLFLMIDGLVYKIVGWLYQLYLVISDARIFTSDTFETFLTRIYAILGVAMLFVLAYSLLQSIVDPDKNEISGAGKIISNTIISIILIAVVPTIFNFLYYAQEIIVKDNIIGKLILGSYSTAADTLSITFDDETCSTIKELSDEENVSCNQVFKADDTSTSVYYAGNSIATDIFSAFYYPAANKLSSDDSTGTSSTKSQITTNDLYTTTFSRSELEELNVKFDKENNEDVFYRTLAYSVCSDSEGVYSANGPSSDANNGFVYGKAAEKCADVVQQANDAAISDKSSNDSSITYKGMLNYAKSEGDFSTFRLLAPTVRGGLMNYTFIISTIAGVFVCYIFVSYCLDMGLRAAKLGFAQLIAPVPILARIMPSKSDTFNRWVSFSLKSYYEVFLRLAVVFLGIFMITNLPDMENLWSNSGFTTISVMSLKLPLILKIDASWGIMSFAKAVVIIGILMFLKQAPTLINEALGISISTGSLNIKNKLKNMVGGAALAGAGAYVGSKASKGYGAISGGLGAGFKAKVNGEKFKDGWKIGSREGLKAGGWQFNKQGNSMYRMISKTNGNGSWFGGESMQDRRERELKELKAKYATTIDNSNRKKVGETEDKQWFKDLTKAVAQGVNDGVLAREQSADFQNYYSAQQAKVRANWDATEGKNIKNRIQNFESGSEYDYYKRAASAYGAEGSQEYEKALKESLRNSKSENVKQYLKDLQRNNNSDEEIKQQAHELTREYFKKVDSQYKQQVECLSDSDKMMKEVRKQMKENSETVSEILKSNNISNNEIKSYLNAEAGLSYADKAKKDKQRADDMELYFKDLKNNKK